MANLNGFDADNAPELKSGFDPVPAGEYVMHIEHSEMTATKAGDGNYLALTWAIDGPTCNGRKLWHNLNLDNRSAEAVRIARAELGAICRAVGVTRPNDSSELHGLPMVVKVAVKERKGRPGEYENRMVAWAPYTGNVAATPTRAPAAKPAPPAFPAAPSGAAPWRPKGVPTQTAAPTPEPPSEEPDEPDGDQIPF